MFAIKNKDGLYLAVSHGDNNTFYYEITNYYGGNAFLFNTREQAEQELENGDVVVEICELAEANTND